MFWLIICTVHLTVCTCHVTYAFQSESTLYSCLTECQGTSCSKQMPYLKFKWLQLDSTPQPLNLQTNTQPFNQTGQMIELCCDYLSVLCIWLYVLFMLRRRFIVNPHSIVAWISRYFFLKRGAISEVKVTSTGLEPKTFSW